MTMKISWLPERSAAKDAAGKKKEEAFQEEEQEVKDMTESCCCTLHCSMADCINEIIAKYEIMIATVCRLPCESTQILHNCSVSDIFFLVVLSVSCLIVTHMLDGSYQAVQIIWAEPSAKATSLVYLHR